MQKTRIVEILEEICPGEEVSASESLVDSRILDSLAIVALVAELEEEFNIVIPAVEIVAENFNSVDALDDLLSRLVEDQIGS